MAGEPYVEDIVVQFEDDTKDFEVKMYPEGDYGDISERVESIEQTLPTKADASDVEALEQTVAGKADSSDVEAIEEALDGKADANEVTSLKEDLGACNSLDLVDTRTLGRSTTSGGITFDFDNHVNKCTVSGTAMSNTFKNIFVNPEAFPDNMSPGKKYYLKYSGVSVSFRVYYYLNGSPVELLVTNTDASFIIPADATGLILRLYVAKNTTVDETVAYNVLNAMTNEELTEAAEKTSEILPNVILTGHILNEIHFNDYRTAGCFYVNKNALENENSENVPPFSINTTLGGYLNVIPQTNGSPTGVVIQSFVTAANAHIYIRRWAGGSQGSWTDWIEQYADEFAILNLCEKSVDVATVTMGRKSTDNALRLTRKSGHNIDNLLPTLTWEVGNITSSGTETDNTHYIRSDYLPTDSGDQFFTQYLNDNPAYRIRFYFYDKNREYLGYSTTFSAFSGDVTGQAYITVGEGYIRFVVLKTPADTLDILPSDISNVDSVTSRLSYKNAEIIRVATNNVRNWGTEHNYGYTGDYESNVRFYQNLYMSVDATMLGFQEFSPYLDAAHQHQSSVFFRNLYTNFYNSISPRIPVASNLPISGFKAGKLSTGRDYAIGVFKNSENEDITWLNFHAYPGTDATATANRQTEYQEIIGLLTGSYIITGDFNANNIEEYDIFKNTGCNLANGGDYGVFLTHDTTPMDNIITSADLQIVYVAMADSAGTSDHKLLYCDVII